MLHTIAKLLLAASLLPLPWLFLHDACVPAGWIGLAALILVRPALRGVGGLAMMVAACTAAIAIAFHWSPDAMAYAVDSTWMVGFAMSCVLFLIDGLRLAAPLWIAGWLCKSPYGLWFAGGVLAVAVEGLFQSVFPWRLGHFQLHWPLLAQSADWFGAGILTFLAYAFAGVIANGWLALHDSRREHASSIEARKLRQWFPRLAPALVCLLAVAHGWWAITHWSRVADVNRPGNRTVRVAVVQVYPSHNQSIRIAQELTEFIAREADLVCRPESIGGTYAMQLEDLSDRDRVFAHSAEPSRGLQPWTRPTCPLLFGGKSFRGSHDVQDQTYVSAFLLGANAEILGRYHKRFLMPFGEYVPLKDTLPYMEDLFGKWDPITPGETPNVLCVGEARIGSMLCYEDMVASAARTLVRGDANILFSLADGSSFENRLTLLQHRLLAHSRAIENRRYFVRCASTGESCIIAPTGVIEKRLPMQTDCVMVGEVALLDQETPYSRFGEMVIFAWVLPSIFVLAVIRFRRGASSRPAGE